ncbi:MAG: hypothetical protein Q8O86_06610 [Dehalococcoidia bacterium]|nr:hypothetical protein [Dehalococcoidia bacterium]
MPRHYRGREAADKWPVLGDEMAVSEELAVLQEVARRLEKAGLPHMVTGSLAVSFYGKPRMTRGIDIVLVVGTDDAEKIHELFSEDFYMDQDAVREAIVRRSLFIIIHYASVIKIDFIVRKDETYRLEEFQRRRHVVMEGVELSIVAPEDLILSKLVWAKESHSELHLRDVSNVLFSCSDLDKTYIEQWAKRLSVESLYKQVLG